MIEQKYTYAVIGASKNEEKYGYKVFKDLLEGGYKVIPINPHESQLLKQKVYPNLSLYPQKIDTVIFVVPPTVTEKVLKEVAKLKIKNVRMQPGSGSKEAINFCIKHKIQYIANACIMIQRRIQNEKI